MILQRYHGFYFCNLLLVSRGIAVHVILHSFLFYEFFFFNNQASNTLKKVICSTETCTSPGPSAFLGIGLVTPRAHVMDVSRNGSSLDSWHEHFAPRRGRDSLRYWYHLPPLAALSFFRGRFWSILSSPKEDSRMKEIDRHYVER